MNPTHLLAIVLLIGCSRPPSAEMLRQRDAFVQAMALRESSVRCEPSRGCLGPPWTCSAVTANGAPTTFWCDDVLCGWWTP